MEQKFDGRHAAHSLTPLKEGMTVWIPDHNYSGKVISQVGPQSYWVSVPSGTLRHNRRHLIISPNEQFDENVDLDSLPDLSEDTLCYANHCHTPDPSVPPIRDGTVYTCCG